MENRKNRVLTQKQIIEVYHTMAAMEQEAELFAYDAVKLAEYLEGRLGYAISASTVRQMAKDHGWTLRRDRKASTDATSDLEARITELDAVQANLLQQIANLEAWLDALQTTVQRLEADRGLEDARKANKYTPRPPRVGDNGAWS